MQAGCTPSQGISIQDGFAFRVNQCLGVVALTVSLAREVAADGITVNAVAPGMMHTEMTAETLERDAERYRKSIPLGRVARTEEIAELVAFLASERNSYMTGATVDASGGLLMGFFRLSRIALTSSSSPGLSVLFSTETRFFVGIWTLTKEAP